MNNLPEIYHFVCVCALKGVNGAWLTEWNIQKWFRCRSRCDRNRVKRSSKIFVECVPKNGPYHSYWAMGFFFSLLIRFFNFDGSLCVRLNHFSAFTRTTLSSCIAFDFLLTFFIQHFKYCIVQHKLRFSPFKLFFFLSWYFKTT